MLRNLLRAFLSADGSHQGLQSLAEVMLERLQEEEATIAANGAGLIRDGMAVFTHCHSSSAVGVLREAHRRGVHFKVFNTRLGPGFRAGSPPPNWPRRNPGGPYGG